MISLQETNKRKELAKEYTDRVIDEMALSDIDLRAIMSRYVHKIVTLSSAYKLGKEFSFSSSPRLEKEVDGILNDFRSELFNIIYMRAEGASMIAHEKEGEDYSNVIFLAFIASAIEGKTLKDRIKEYTENLKYEIEAYAAAGLDKGMNATGIVAMFLLWINKPFKSPLITNAFKGGYSALRLKSRGMTFGVGKSISTFNNLKLLEQDVIFRSFNHTVNELWSVNANVVGWYTVRGSSYPCALCDDMRGVFHPKTEYYYGYHNRCCCIMIPVYLWDM